MLIALGRALEMGSERTMRTATIELSEEEILAAVRDYLTADGWTPATDECAITIHIERGCSDMREGPVADRVSIRAKVTK